MAEYINKQELIKNIVNTPISWDYPVTSEHLTGAAKRQNEILTLIDDMPAADVRKNKHGHWIETEDGDLQCSECGHLTDDWVDIFSPSKRDCVSGKRAPMLSWATKHPYFCGKCGADMRGEK